MSIGKGTRKSVYFGEDDDEILKYALKQDDKFAAYVKDLIKKDMKKEPLEKTVIKIVEDYLETKKVSLSEVPNSKDTAPESDFDNQDILALNKLMGRGKLE